MKAVYANETDYFSEHRHNLKYCAKLVSYLDDILAGAPITIEWLHSRNELIQLYICVMLLGEYYCEASPTPQRKEILTFFSSQNFNTIDHDYLHYYSAMIHLSLGNLDKAAAHCAHIKESKSGFSLSLQATIAFLTAQLDSATALYRKALPALRKQYESRGYYLDNIQGLFHNLCLAYKENNLAQIDINIEQYYKYAANHMFMPMDTVYDLMPLFLVIEQGKQKKQDDGFLSFGINDKAKKATPTCSCRISFIRLYRQQRIHSKK